MRLKMFLSGVLLLFVHANWEMAADDVRECEADWKQLRGVDRRQVVVGHSCEMNEAEVENDEDRDGDQQQQHRDLVGGVDVESSFEHAGVVLDHHDENQHQRTSAAQHFPMMEQGEFLRLLNEIRTGETPSDTVSRLLNLSRKHRQPGLKCTRIYGTNREVDAENQKVSVLVSIFGRDTPVELENWQVEKYEEEKK